MRLRDRRSFKQPEIMVIPMIDIMFFLLVFFMLGSIYMIEQRSLPVRLPAAQTANIDANVNFTITMKKDGALYLEDKPAELSSLLQQARRESQANPKLAIVIRADREVEYGQVVGLMDRLKEAGVQRFGLATQKAGGADGG